MADVIPFRAVRPSRDKAHLVATRSYISYSNEQMAEKLENNPFSFLQIIHPPAANELDGVEKFEKVREEYLDFCYRGILKKDENPAFYVYEQRYGDHVFTGIISGIAVEDYKTGHIKKHEHTLPEREKMFKNYLKTTGVNAEPVLLTYTKKDKIEELLERVKKSRPEYEFSTTDKHTHTLWVIDDQNDIEIIQQEFSDVESVYIADGHHRSASSSLLADDLRSEQKKPSDYFMAYLISDQQMEIRAFHRLVSSLNGQTIDEFLTKIKQSFEVESLGENRYQPHKLHEFGMYVNREWYRLTPHRENIDLEHPVEQLDCQILSSLILNPILGVEDEKTDKRVKFMGDLEGLEGLEQNVNNGSYDVGFAVYPVTVEQLKNVADNNMIMPPKSTWVEPKLRSGLTIYDILEF
ncbi:DUF1015 domain-containing protein [Salibacter halophilus]|uniref:DUF1015 domain-containing protein n=1 Tax=Salibacter halophilus TaxID=1803916 RepID=A0A6N6MA17_9FLAO|nr:DUF1015 family protein [Salibacter halophilus]KAB1066082.1 DUF1015 domain-containing protein [Salibacter halophilus]